MYTSPITIPQQITTPDLVKFLPHKGKMFLLSRVIQHSCENHSITTEYDITSGCIFYEAALGGIPSWVSFELMAQSISALIGIENKKKGKPPLPGFILSVSNFKAGIESFQNGSTVRMHVQEEFTADTVSQYECTCFEQQNLKSPAVTAKITVMGTNDLKYFFGENSNEKRIKKN